MSVIFIFIYFFLFADYYLKTTPENIVSAKSKLEENLHKSIEQKQKMLKDIESFTLSIKRKKEEISNLQKQINIIKDTRIIISKGQLKRAKKFDKVHREKYLNRIRKIKEQNKLRKVHRLKRRLKFIKQRLEFYTRIKARSSKTLPLFDQKIAADKKSIENFDTSNINFLALELTFMVFILFACALSYFMANKKLPYAQNNGFNLSPIHSDFSNTQYWESMRQNSTNFATHRLVEKAHNQLTITATLQLKVFYYAFFYVGLNSFLFQLISLLVKYDFKIESMQLHSINLTGLLFMLVGIFIKYRFSGKDIIFDKDKSVLIVDKNHHIPFHSMQALQIIEGIGGGYDHGVYTVYELNIILKNKERIHLFSGGNRSSFTHDSNKLANFLQLPLWKI